MSKENFKLRQHHVHSVYMYIFGRNEKNLSTWEYWKKDGYTKKEYIRNLSCLETVKNLPKDTIIEITSFDDFICEGCTRKDSKRRRMQSCVKPDGNSKLDDLFCDSVDILMDISVGDIYTIEELFELMTEYSKIKEKLPEISKRIIARGEHDYVPPVRLEIIKDGLLPADYYSIRKKLR